jgi:hypothetical protein
MTVRNSHRFHRTGNFTRLFCSYCPLGRRSTARWCGASFSECPLLFSPLPARVRHPHLPLGRRDAIKRTALCAFALNTRLAPLDRDGFARHCLFHQTFCLLAHCLLRHFALSCFLQIGHRAGRRPRQRRCSGTMAHESVTSITQTRTSFLNISVAHAESRRRGSTTATHPQPATGLGVREQLLAVPAAPVMPWADSADAAGAFRS